MMFKNPQNFKDGNLIMNKYRVIDLAIFTIGVITSFVLLVVVLSNMKPGTLMMVLAIISILPGLFATAFVAKLQGFHNVFEFLKFMLFYYTKYQKRFMWEGVVLYEEETI